MGHGFPIHEQLKNGAKCTETGRIVIKHQHLSEYFLSTRDGPANPCCKLTWMLRSKGSVQTKMPFEGKLLIVGRGNGCVGTVRLARWKSYEPNDHFEEIVLQSAGLCDES